MSGANAAANPVELGAAAALSSRSQASAAIEAAHVKLAKMLPEGMITLPTTMTSKTTKYDPKQFYQQWLDPQLPPFLAPIPQFCRLIAFIIIAPIIIICLTDFAGYAIFRTLGFRRRRVRVKQQIQETRRNKSTQTSLPPPLTASNLAISNERQPESPSLQIRAPLLTPGAYDAETLLRHRARSISGESVEAEEEWIRTGGRFARVSTVRASQEAAAAAIGTPEIPIEERSSVSINPLPRFNFLTDVGVEGALGYSDTDADDSGAESGRNSPEIQRKPWRRGLTSSSLGFTPVSPSPREVGGDQMGLGVYNDSGLSAQQNDAHIEASRAADLEPISSAKLQTLQS